MKQKSSLNNLMASAKKAVNETMPLIGAIIGLILYVPIMRASNQSRLERIRLLENVTINAMGEDQVFSRLEREQLARDLGYDQTFEDRYKIGFARPFVGDDYAVKIENGNGSHIVSYESLLKYAVENNIAIPDEVNFINLKR